MKIMFNSKGVKNTVQFISYYSYFFIIFFKTLLKEITHGKKELKELFLSFSILFNNIIILF